ncbi:MAG: hypothetical protein M1136_00880 [Chloroflexi bacterium]|nr:hypothetical protein [Chloroflexota bacterium]
MALDGDLVRPGGHRYKSRPQAVTALRRRAERRLQALLMEEMRINQDS